MRRGGGDSPPWNVRYLLETYHNIGYFMDIHSYSELVLYLGRAATTRANAPP